MDVMFYLIVSFAILAYRIFKAAQTDFTYGPKDSDIDMDKLMPYVLTTIFVVLAWPLALTFIAIYKLGQRFKKEN